MPEIRHREPTEQEAAEIARASYIIREIGNPAIRGYADDKIEAYGMALVMALHNMLSEGSQIDIAELSDNHIELRISESREEVTVKWVKSGA